jgi:hypothetical protein
MGVSARQADRMDKIQRRMEERRGAPVFLEVPPDGWFFHGDRVFLKTSAMTGQEGGCGEIRQFRSDYEVAW